MSLRKSPLMTPARLEANRRNARKSTGPRTARGKAQSRMNSLRKGWASPTYLNLLRALMDAPPCAVEETVGAILTPEQAAHPVFAKLVEMAWEAEIGVARANRELNTALRKKGGPHLEASKAGMLLKINDGELGCL